MEPKTLYLDGRQPIAVRLDGPALRVETPDRAPGRYPLRRLARIVVSGEVDMATPALVACLGLGIVVVFLDGEGSLAGLCVGYGPSQMTLHERIIEFGQQPGWQEIYENWYAAMERRRVLVLVRRLRLSVTEFRPLTVMLHLFSRASHLPVRVIHRARSWAEAAAHACAARAALESGIAPDTLHDPDRDLHLVRDLGRILAWDARGLAAEYLSGLGPHEPLRRAELAARFEDRLGHHARVPRECLNCLDRLIRDPSPATATRRRAHG